MQSKFTYVYDMGRVKNVKFQIGARHDPNPNNVVSFAVILFFELQDGTRIEVAKIDNIEHSEGEIHLDRYYRERGAEIKDFEIEVEDCWEAEKYIVDNWKHFASTYLQNHGQTPR